MAARWFADMSPGFADGIRTDRDGNLWSSVGLGRTRNGRRALLDA